MSIFIKMVLSQWLSVEETIIRLRERQYQDIDEEMEVVRLITQLFLQRKQGLDQLVDRATADKTMAMKAMRRLQPRERDEVLEALADEDDNASNSSNSSASTVKEREITAFPEQGKERE